MWTLICCLLLSISTVFSVSTVFVPSNTTYKLKISTPNPTLEWRENNNAIFTLSYNSTSDACNFYPATTGFIGYCVDNGAAYELEILNTSNHDGSVFTGDNKICTIVNATMANITTSSVELNDDENVQIEVVVFETKPTPSFLLIFKVQNVEKNLNFTGKPDCNDVLSTHNFSCSINVSTLIELYDEKTFSVEQTFSIEAMPYYGDYANSYFGPRTDSVSIHFNPGGPHECYCYCLILVIIKAVLVVVAIILVIVHFCRKEAKAEGNVYWVLNVGFIIDGPVCFVLSIIQILYQIKAIACSRCMDRSGYDAAIALVVCGIIAAIVCIVFFVIRLKQRGKKTLNKPTEMKKTDPENKVSETRPLPLPKSS